MDRRDKFDVALKGFYETTLTVLVGLSDVPSISPGSRYIILNQSPSPRPYGDLQQPESIRCWDYLIKSVGLDHRATAALSSQVRQVTTERDDTGYLFDLTVVGFTIIDRSTISEGAIVRAAGPNLFEVNDIYRFEVE